MEALSWGAPIGMAFFLAGAGVFFWGINQLVSGGRNYRLAAKKMECCDCKCEKEKTD